jgi:hypothetical protein
MKRTWICFFPLLFCEILLMAVATLAAPADDSTKMIKNPDGSHGRTEDFLADALVKADPNRSVRVSTSGYIKGVDC